MLKIRLSLFITGLFTISGLFSISAKAQSDLPPSFYTSGLKSNPERVVLIAPDKNLLAEEDKIRDNQGKMYRYGVGIETQINPYNSGTWEVLSDGSRLWRLEIDVEAAKAIGLSYSDFFIPKGAKFYLYNPSKVFVTNPVVNADNPSGSIYATQLTPGDVTILEYYAPQNVTEEFVLNIEQVVYAYRAVTFTDLTKDFGDAGSCEVNAACSPESDNFQNQRRSAVRISVKDGGQFGWCSGALINNTKSDCTPYILTANHCGGGATTSDMKGWVFYFNYEAPSCANPASQGSLAANTITGAIKVANSSDVSDVIGSDFILALMSKRPTASWNAYYSGWNKSGTASTSGVSIHHPAGDIKKISTYTQTVTSTSWTGTPGTHWSVKWAGTTNGHGVTEGGSSGSPLFDANGRIIGQLSGGSSFCTPASAQNSPDAYGKFSYNWTTGTTSNRRLKDWLDPLNSNPSTLDGRDNTCAAGTLPTVDFVAAPLTVNVGQSVSFTDQTTGSPFIWEWKPSSNYTFTNSTTAATQNPKASFSVAGTYSVYLYAGNNAGFGTKFRPNYIKVNANASVENDYLSNLKLFPNPNKGILNVDLGSNVKENINLIIFDIAGREVYQASNLAQFGVHDISALNNGIYTVVITNGKFKNIQKVVLAR